MTYNTLTAVSLLDLHRGKSGSREDSWEAITLVQMRDEVAWTKEILLA